MIKSGNGKYCSRKCSQLNNKTKIKKGQRLSPETEFKNGLEPWNKGIPCSDETKKKVSLANKGKTHPDNQGEKNPNWKGDEIGYQGLHSWVHKILGKATKCEYCGSMEIVDWANKSQEYKRDINDWLELCRKCHFEYDNSRKRDVKGRFI